MARPFIVGVGGFTSNVGKTTLMCELLKAFPGWEAIKTTRGHYRSCGKDSEACCVSHLLNHEPLIRSGRDDTYELGKDTGRYWDAGASNVHWLIATDNQIDQGIREALSRVRSEGVFVEGNSFSQFVETDYFVMVKSAGSDSIKKSAKAIVSKVEAVYLSEFGSTTSDNDKPEKLINDRPPFIYRTLPSLILEVRRALTDVAAVVHS
jgi:molybdopterin-guanine dinucleotide biosynthesis protein